MRDAQTMLHLPAPRLADLLGCAAGAERAATSHPVDESEVLAQVRSMRYILVEDADGPIAAFMADSAARIIGDGIGRLFV
ncbi:hypothetical protein [Micromonospora aurantiaca]|uniref:hypothetical protein n=1 Tax=Micromonospora aurantiaca (nom. illeg.) TaxID=47850 RepID=UPI0011CDD3A7|nr:hypothetical protein [Micromonospora aurantiaca]